MRVEVGASLSFDAIAGVPIVRPGDDVSACIITALEGASVDPRPGDVLVVASKIVSRAEARFTDLSKVAPSGPALELARTTGQDPRLVHVVLEESASVSRAAAGVLIVRHRLGFVSANAGIDASNVGPRAAGSSEGDGAIVTDRSGGPWVLRLPVDPDRSARMIADAVGQVAGGPVGVVISDSHGRPFRRGQLGTAIGVAGLPARVDRRGDEDLFGRVLEQTELPIADAVAVAADLVAGPGDEARPLTLVRGLRFEPSDEGVAPLLRSAETDLYA